MISSPTAFTPRLLPLRLPRVCVAVIGSDPAEMVEKAEALVRDNSFLEFRLDYLSKPALALPKVKRFIESHPGAVVIATCRRVANGGKFHGSMASQLEVLSKAAAAGCQMIDIDLQTASQCKPGHLQMLPIPADFYKIASTAATLSDNVTMIKFLAKESDRHSMVCMSMGEQGFIS